MLALSASQSTVSDRFLDQAAGNMRQSQEPRTSFDLSRMSQEGYRSGGFRSINEEIRPDLRGNPDLAGVGIFFQVNDRSRLLSMSDPS
eukprot:748379-Hanusia_phi.AAC.3